MDGTTNKISVKVTRWVVFTVLLSILPIVCSLFAYYFRGGWNFEKISYNGEIFLICTAISGDAIGEAIGIKPKYKVINILTIGVCMLLALFSIYSYVEITKANLEPNTVKIENVFSVSMWTFISTFISGLICVIFSELESA